MTEDAPSEFPCGLCEKQGRHGMMRLVVHGRYSCSTCESTINTDVLETLPRLFYDLRNVAIVNDCRIPEPPAIPTPLLRTMFQDAWLCLVLGRYHASIVLLSVFCEALLKEAIQVHSNERTKKPFGPAIEHALTTGIIAEDDALRLHEFRQQARNLWVHHDVIAIAGEVILPVWMVEFPTGDSEAILKAVNAMKEGATSGRMPPTFVKAKDHPWALDAAVGIVAEKTAFAMYEDVWMFTVRFVKRYLLQEHYTDHHRRWPTPDIPASVAVTPRDVAPRGGSEEPALDQ